MKQYFSSSSIRQPRNYSLKCGLHIFIITKNNQNLSRFSTEYKLARVTHFHIVEIHCTKVEFNIAILKGSESNGTDSLFCLS